MSTSRILLVEDNPGDVELFREALLEMGVGDVRVATDGVVASELIKEFGKKSSSSVPDLILLDVNLPRKNGFEVLCELKLDAKLRSIPVIMFTSSSSSSDVVKAYEEYANSYVVKPARAEEYITVVRELLNYWLHISDIPAHDFA